MSDGDEEIDERQEAEALGRIAHAIACYRSDAHAEISRWEASAARLALRSHRDDAPSSPSAAAALAALFSRLRAKHLAARAAAERNARWLDSLLEATVGFSNREGRASGPGGGSERRRPEGGDDDDDDGSGGGGCSPYAPAAAAVARSLVASGALPSAGDADKVRYVLKNAARDWSASGKEERAASYGRVVEALSRALPPGRGTAVAPPGSGGEGGEGGADGGAGFFEPARVLVPGSGLGRLCVDLVAAGFAAQGNEFSYYMLLASAFALNFCCGAGGTEGGAGGGSGGGEEGEEEEEEEDPRPTVHPWVLTPCNWLRDADQLAGVRVPDVDPAAVVAAAAEAAEAEAEARRRRKVVPPPASSSSLGPCPPRHHGDDPPSSSSKDSSSKGGSSSSSSYPLLSMVAGDFAQVYSHRSREGTFDAVATCFFLDTAHNVLDYIETIKHVLVKNGEGVWVNFGPLLYHWADAASYLPSAEGEEAPASLELPLDEVLLAVAAAGFEIVELETDLPATFNATPRSMLRSGYVCAQWTAVLRKEGGGREGGMEGVEVKKSKE